MRHSFRAIRIFWHDLNLHEQSTIAIKPCCSTATKRAEYQVVRHLARVTHIIDAGAPRERAISRRLAYTEVLWPRAKSERLPAPILQVREM